VEGIFSFRFRGNYPLIIPFTLSILSIPSTLLKNKNITLNRKGKKMAQAVGMVLDRIEAQQANALQLRPDATSIDLLRAVYRSTSLPLPVRLRAAIAALPHEVPRLAVTALVNEQSFAEILDRRLKRIKEIENGNGNQIEAKPQQVEIQPMLPRSTVEVRPPLAPTNDRRFRRF
jgi:hypothetical protein